MNARSFVASLLSTFGCLLWVGCHGHVPHEQMLGPPYDHPFPLGQVSDAHWETQQTNAEAADFIFYDHEFVGHTEELTQGGKRHLLQIALRLNHVPFPVVVEQSPQNRDPQLDAQRRLTVLDALRQLGVPIPDERVVVAPAFAEGLSAIEGEQAYSSTLSGGFGGGGGGRGGFGGGTGRRFGGMGGAYR